MLRFPELAKRCLKVYPEIDLVTNRDIADIWHFSGWIGGFSFNCKGVPGDIEWIADADRLFHGLVGRAIGDYRTTDSGSKEPTPWAAADGLYAGSCEYDFVPQPNRLPVGPAASRPTAQEHRVRLLCPVA